MNKKITSDQARKRRQSTVVTVVRDYHIWHMIRHIALIAFLLVYAFIGGAVFYWLEAPEQERLSIVRANLTSLRQSILVHALFDVHVACKGDDDCWDGFESQVLDYEAGLELATSSSKYQWDFWNSLFYAGTIVTTIGYGHMYCQTYWGKLATMIYALFGIPLVLAVLNYLGKTLFTHARRNWNRLLRFLRLICCRTATKSKNTYEITRKISTTNSIYEDEEANFPLILALLMVVGYTFLCAWIFSFWETQWDYFTAFYYFFITLSTIGLGDLVPEHPRYALVGFILVIIGLSLVTMCINIMQTHVEDRYSRALKDLEQRWDLASELGDVPNGLIVNRQNDPASPQPMFGAMDYPREFNDEFFESSKGIIKFNKQRMTNEDHYCNVNINRGCRNSRNMNKFQKCATDLTNTNQILAKNRNSTISTQSDYMIHNSRNMPAVNYCEHEFDEANNSRSSSPTHKRARSCELVSLLVTH